MDGQEVLSAVTRWGEVVVEGHPVGMLEGFNFAPDPSAAGDEKKLVLRAARRALREEMPRRVAVVEGEPDTAFSLTPAHRIAWGGAPVARIVGGATALSPRVQVLDSEFLDGTQRERLRARLQRFLDEQIRTDLAPLFAAADAAERVPGARGPLHRLRETLGLVPGIDEETLAPELRPKLKAIGVRSGRFALFLPAMMRPRAAAMRARLWSIRHGFAAPALPGAGSVSLPATTDWPPGFGAAMGWVEAGPVLLRVDIAERVAAELGYATRKGPVPLPPDMASRFAVKADMVPAVLRALGFRVVPSGVLSAQAFGPPAPPMLAPLRRGVRTARSVRGFGRVEALDGFGSHRTGRSRLAEIGQMALVRPLYEGA
jgi:ATP-dependent RNA helicase SUPV3L1/SUV3